MFQKNIRTISIKVYWAYEQSSVLRYTSSQHCWWTQNFEQGASNQHINRNKSMIFIHSISKYLIASTICFCKCLYWSIIEYYNLFINAVNDFWSVSRMQISKLVWVSTNPFISSWVWEIYTLSNYQKFVHCSICLWASQLLPITSTGFRTHEMIRCLFLLWISSNNNDLSTYWNETWLIHTDSHNSVVKFFIHVSFSNMRINADLRQCLCLMLFYFKEQLSHLFLLILANILFILLSKFHTFTHSNKNQTQAEKSVESISWRNINNCLTTRTVLLCHIDES